MNRKMDLREQKTETIESNGDLILDGSSPGFEINYRIDRVLYTGQTPFQKIDIIQNPVFGGMLFLDNDLQISEYDAHLYNKAMVDPLLLEKVCRDNTVILGGGDGGILKELLLNPPKIVTLVDIDKAVVDACAEYLPSICGSAFSHPNVEIRFEDAFKFLDEKNQFDVIVYDLTMHPEPISELPREQFLDSIFKKMCDRLKPSGIISMQCCSAYDKDALVLTKTLLNRYFQKHTIQSAFIPSFGEPWLFASAHK